MPFVLLLEEKKNKFVNAVRPARKKKSQAIDEIVTAKKTLLAIEAVREELVRNVGDHGQLGAVKPIVEGAGRCCPIDMLRQCHFWTHLGC